MRDEGENNKTVWREESKDSLSLVWCSTLSGDAKKVALSILGLGRYVEVSNGVIQIRTGLEIDRINLALKELADAHVFHIVRFPDDGTFANHEFILNYPTRWRIPFYSDDGESGVTLRLYRNDDRVIRTEFSWQSEEWKHGT